MFKKIPVTRCAKAIAFLAIVALMAFLAIGVGIPAMIIGNILAILWMCKEREEWPWEIFGKSATEGEYGRSKNKNPVPSVPWLGRLFRNNR